MDAFDPRALKAHAIPICLWWQEPGREALLSSDLPAFQYRMFCNNKNIALAPYIADGEYGLFVEKAFQFDVRYFLQEDEFPMYASVEMFPEEYRQCLETPFGYDISEHD